MIEQVNLYEAKTRLSRLVDDVAAGGTVIIAKGGKPMAKLVPLGDSHPRQPRRIGQLAKGANGVDWAKWWRDWKSRDKETAADFEAAARTPLPAPGLKSRPKRRA